MKCRVLIVSALILSLMASAVFPQSGGQTAKGGRRSNDDLTLNTGQTTQPKKKSLHKLADPEAAALFIHLVERYAKDVRDKTQLDERIERRFAQTPGVRETAKRMAEKFRGIPIADRRAMLGQWADISAEQKIPISQYRVAFDRLAKSAKKPQSAINRDEHTVRSRTIMSAKHRRSESQTKTAPVPERRPNRPVTNANRPKLSSMLPPLQRPRFNRRIFTNAVANPTLQQGRFALQYEGMWCQSETDADHATDSDEIYIVTQVIDSRGEDPTTTNPRPHNPKWYVDVDDNEHRRGPQRRCWGGQNGQPAQDLTLIVTAFEQDNGDVDVVGDILGGLALVAYAIASFIALPDSPTSEHVNDDVAEAVNILLVIAFMSTALGLLWELFTGGADDLISIETRHITARQIRDWANQAPRLSRTGSIPYHFSTIHIGEDDALGADYHFYFTFARVDR